MAICLDYQVCACQMSLFWNITNFSQHSNLTMRLQCSIKYNESTAPLPHDSILVKVKLEGTNMFRALFILIVFVTTLQGCATSREVFLADGTKGYNINCSGSGMNYSNCLEKAGEICGTRGYDLLNQQGDAVPFAQAIREFGANTQSASVGYFTYSGSTITRNLFIKCK